MDSGNRELPFSTRTARLGYEMTVVLVDIFLMKEDYCRKRMKQILGLGIAKK